MPKKIKEGVGSESSETNKPEEQVAPKLSKDELDLAKEEAKKEARKIAFRKLNLIIKSLNKKYEGNGNEF